jgi:hypothetical protein
MSAELRCEAGQATDPTGYCERHSRHYFCGTCQGYYGVPHAGIHSGPGAHPHYRDARTCACRVCKDYVAQLARDSQ